MDMYRKYRIYVRNTACDLVNPWIKLRTYSGIGISTAFVLSELENNNNPQLRYRITLEEYGVERIIFEQKHPHGE